MERQSQSEDDCRHDLVVAVRWVDCDARLRVFVSAVNKDTRLPDRVFESRHDGNDDDVDHTDRLVRAARLRKDRAG